MEIKLHVPGFEIPGDDLVKVMKFPGLNLRFLKWP
jgi:hypothetical protein